MARFPRANCYGYALGLDYNVSPGTRGGADCEVSNWSNMKGVKRVTDKHRRALLAACEHDGLTRKSTLYVGDKGVKIAVFIHIYDDCLDYHFYRQEPDGDWSHKLGASGLEQEVHEPKTADAALIDLGISGNGTKIRREAFLGFLWAPQPFPVTGEDWSD